MRQPNIFATIFAIGTIAFLPSCESLSLSRRPLTASLRTDSSQIGVHYTGNGYAAKIGFVYTNTTAGPVSKSGCGSPASPGLEKRVNGKWVPAYFPAYPACLSKPDFMLRSGQILHDVLDFAAYEPGHHIGPELLVDSIDGIYRLRWDFAEGTDATEKGVRLVKSTSNEFRMVLIEH